MSVINVFQLNQRVAASGVEETFLRIKIERWHVKFENVGPIVYLECAPESVLKISPFTFDAVAFLLNVAPNYQFFVLNEENHPNMTYFIRADALLYVTKRL